MRGFPVSLKPLLGFEGAARNEHQLAYARVPPYLRSEKYV